MDASSPSGHVIVYSTYANSSEDLFVPVNSSGITVYPDWHVYLFGAGSFSFQVNGTVQETGVSLGAFNFTYAWNLPGGAVTNAVLTFMGTSYTFSDVITGPLSNQAIESVSVSSSYAGQDQFLTVSPGTAGALMYPDWQVTMQSTQNESYSVYLNGQDLMSGYVYGSRIVEFNISGSSATVTIGLGNKVFAFKNEIIATVPIQKYYGPPPIPLVATFTDEIIAAMKGVVGLFPALLLSYFSLKPIVVNRKNRTPVVW
ncbi:MAG: hypothetical protein ACYCT2_04470 [Thermoplasmataceae archaeon]